MDPSTQQAVLIAAIGPGLGLLGAAGGWFFGRRKSQAETTLIHAQAQVAFAEAEEKRTDSALKIARVLEQQEELKTSQEVLKSSQDDMKQTLREIRAELSFNHGGSTKDAVRRIEHSQRTLAQEVQAVKTDVAHLKHHATPRE